MAAIEPIRKDIATPSLTKKNSIRLRIWHWLNVIIISGSFITVLINSTLLDRDNSGIVSHELLNAGATINGQQAGAVIHGMEDQVWGIHIYFGYALGILLLFRMVSEFFQPKNQQFFPKLKVAYDNYFVKAKERRLARHELVTKSLYLLFYVLLLLMTFTGLTMAFDTDLGITKTVSHQIKEVHGFIMYLIIGFIFLHVLGVALAEQKDGKGIVSDMINGGEQH